MNRLDKLYAGAVDFDIRDATTKESKKEMQVYGFRSHGMVILDAEGNVKWRMDGHSMTSPEITQALEMVLENSK